MVIVGAGVTGLTVATCLTDAYGDQIDLTILADRFSPDTTSDQAGADLLGGLWWFEDSRRRSWAHTSLRHFERLYRSPVRKEIGMHKILGYRLFKDDPSFAWCFDELPQYFRLLSKEETETLGPAYSGYIVYECTTILLKCTKYLPWLMDELRARGCLIVRRKIENLSELSTHDIVINCTGLWSHDLVGDKDLYPLRGQSVVVRAPGIDRFHTFADVDSTKLVYIFPYEDHVVIGGNKDAHNWSTTRDPETDREILQRCARFEPRLKEAEVIGGWACLRPQREPVRLEVEDPRTSPAVLHNYGHGGVGVVVSWGCAMETVGLVHQCLVEKGFTHLIASAKL